MRQFKFEHLFAQQILKGTRNSTLRIDDRGIFVGEKLQVVDKLSSNKPQEWEVVGEMTITGKQEFRLADVPRNLFEKSEVSSSDMDEVLQFLRRFYGESISFDTIVSLFSFDFHKYERPLQFLTRTELATQTDAPESVIIYADGGSRGNPGPSASGYVIEDETGKVLQTWNKYLGVTTNNQAEYHGLIAALEWCSHHNIQQVTVRLDSLLVVNQMKGIFKVKNRDLWALHDAAKRLGKSFKDISYTHVPREMNRKADAEVNLALDAIVSDDVVQ